jgi:hypothetical protein
MDITLSAREAEAVLRALDTYLPQLEFELARVKLERDRHEYVVLDETLRALHARLRSSASDDRRAAA